MTPYAVIGFHTCTSSACNIPSIVVHPTMRAVTPTAARRNLIGMQDTAEKQPDPIRYPDARMNPYAIDELESVVAGMTFGAPVLMYARKLQRFVLNNHCVAFQTRVAMRRIEDPTAPDVEFHACHDHESCSAPRFTERPRRSLGPGVADPANERCQDGAYQMARTHLLEGPGVIVVDKVSS